MAELILKVEVYAVVGAAMEVYYKLGIGFLEPIYQEALEIELTRRGIPFESEKALELYYKDTLMTKKISGRFGLLWSDHSGAKSHFSSFKSGMGSTHQLP